MKKLPLLFGKFFFNNRAIFTSLFLIFSTFQIQAHTSSHRATCKKIVNSKSKFSSFRQSTEIRKQFDFVTYEESLSYINWLKNFARVLNKKERKLLLKQDIIGKPILSTFENYSACPTTWRTIKIAMEIKNEFGSLSDRDLVDIGGGYGGLCRILAFLDGFRSYTFVNYSECNSLIKKFLEPLNLPNVFFIDLESSTETIFSRYDLVISDQSFFELQHFEQDYLLNHLIRKTANGYFIFSSSKNENVLEEKYTNFIKTLIREDYHGKLRPIFPAIGKESLLLTWKDRKIKHSLHSKFSSRSLELQTKKKAISYELTGGRFGDNVIAYLHAKWLSYQYQLPLLYVPFQYSDKLYLHHHEKTNDLKNAFKHTFSLVKDTFQKFNSRHNSALWILKPFPECFFEFIDPQLQAKYYKNLKYFCIDWEDEAFLLEIKKCLEPICPINQFNLSKDFINIALHVRRIGSSPFDGLPVRDYFPLKFPNDNFYLDQLKWLAEFFPQKNLFVFIFTDDPNPGTIAESYQEKLQNPRIFFEYRPFGDWSNESLLLEDFYNMAQFDCLIRPGSNFSIAAAKLADYQIEIGPAHATKNQIDYDIDQVEVVFKGSK